MLRIPHTWAVSGEVKVASGDTDFVLPFYVPVPAGQTVRLVGVRARINNGASASATFKMQRDGADITGYTGIVASNTSPSVTADGGLFTDSQTFALVITAVTGTPRNLTVTAFLDYTVS